MDKSAKNSGLVKLVNNILPQISKWIGKEKFEAIKDYLSSGISINNEEDVAGIVKDCVNILSKPIKDGGINRLPSIKTYGINHCDTVEVGGSITLYNQIEYVDGSFYSYDKDGTMEFISAGCQPGNVTYFLNGRNIDIPDTGYTIHFDNIGSVDVKIVQSYEGSVNTPKKSNGNESSAYIGNGACSYHTKYYAYNTIFFGFGDTYTDAIEESTLHGRYRTTEIVTRVFNDCEVVPMKFAWYMYPKRLGKVNILGHDSTFTYNFDFVDTIDYTNSNGYTESYYLYKSIDMIAYSPFSVEITN